MFVILELDPEVQTPLMKDHRGWMGWDGWCGILRFTLSPVCIGMGVFLGDFGICLSFFYYRERLLNFI